MAFHMMSAPIIQKTAGKCLDLKLYFLLSYANKQHNEKFHKTHLD